MKQSDVLICVFSFNMGSTLDNCLSSTEALCGGIDVVIMDDNSVEPRTVKVIEKWKDRFKVFVNTDPKEGRKHGNLYRNIQKMFDYARERGYRYLFMVQDDMQFVRPLTGEILAQYGRLFDADPKRLQVDPRFLKRGQRVEIVKDGYVKNDRASYVDVGIVHLDRLTESGWQMVEGERQNKRALAAMGYIRVLARTPVLMHVPFPPRYRNGSLKRSMLLRRGSYSYYPMTASQIEHMDSRDPSSLPTYRRFLSVRNMTPIGLLAYWFRKDLRIFA
ncbi:glycosyltransferase [Mesorhizobium sp. KR9-304]|uniref:glycosyltransferase n=1 Tax=Mesorhizobium sp. KR9-304 TaxID=3156614 RepID=UPI0032B3A6C5